MRETPTCRYCGTDLTGLSKHYVEESDGSWTRYCPQHGMDRERYERDQKVS